MSTTLRSWDWKFSVAQISGEAELPGDIDDYLELSVG